jgi:protease I
MAAKNILFLVGDYAEDYEVMVPFQAMQMVGHNVHAVCPGKQKGQAIRTAIHDFEGDQTYSEKPGHLFTLNESFATIEVGDYDALMIAGGRAPEYLRLNESVIQIIQDFARTSRPIAAICHGTQLLTAANVIGGKRISAYPACAPEVRQAGATYVELGFTEAVTDGNFVTAPAWPAHPAWLAQFLTLLKTEISV